jgi:ectoine hydroxylase-related dioxygenase (phytanoyl-CoA dioxygenase family)
MDPQCLDYQLTDEEHLRFEQDGYIMVEDAISPEQIARLTTAADRIDAEERARQSLSPQDGQNILDFIGRDEAFLELLDWPKTFPKVWGILGWNIQLYHSHFIVTPPKATSGPGQSGLNWHKDSGRLNFELESNPQPRISLKVAFFLTDTSEVGRANLYVIPGSHLQNSLDRPEQGDPPGATAVLAKPGTAVFFDRRIWHASSPNTSNVARKVLFYGYSYRWLRPRDDMSVGHYLATADPIRRQLLGASNSGGHGYSSPKPDDVPLKAWLEEHLDPQGVPA